MVINYTACSFLLISHLQLVCSLEMDSASGYEDKSFETYITVDPDVILGDESTGGEAIPGYSIFFIGLTAVGTLGLIYVIFKRKQQI